MITLIKTNLSKYSLKAILIMFIIYSLYLTSINIVTFNQFINIGIFVLLGVISTQLTRLNENYKEK